MMILPKTCVTIKMAGDGREGWLWLSHGSVLSPIEILIAFPPSLIPNAFLLLGLLFMMMFLMLMMMIIMISPSSHILNASPSPL